MSLWTGDGLTGNCVWEGEGSGLTGGCIPASPCIWDGLKESREILDYVPMLITVEKFLLKDLQLAQLVFPMFGDGMQQSFKREILFRKYLLLTVKIILNQVKYTIFWTKKPTKKIENHPDFCNDGMRKEKIDLGKKSLYKGYKRRSISHS